VESMGPRTFSKMGHNHNGAMEGMSRTQRRRSEVEQRVGLRADPLH
jgi:hypothetical protein